MKRLLLVVLIALLGLIAVVVGRTLLLPPAAFNSTPVSLPEGLDGQLAAESLAAAIRLPTLSHQVGTPTSQQAASDAAFAGLREWMTQRYPHVTASTEQLSTGSPSILLRWPGRDSQLPAALLVAILEAVETLIAQGFQPQRDVLLAFGHDEEIGGHQGNRRIAAQLQEQGKRLAWVSDEGGFVVRGQIPGVSQDVAVVGIAEKGYVSLTLQANAQGGHSSQPPAFDETAIGRLSQALHRVGDAPFQRGFDGPTGDLLASFTAAQSFGYRLIFANLWLFGPLVEQQLAASPAGAAQLQTSLSPTLLRAGIKENVLPPSARATLNLRIHPRDSIASVAEHVRNAVADEQIQVKVMPAGREPSAVPDVNGDAYKQFAEVIRQSFSNTLVSPNLTVGGIDSRYYEPLTDNIFRFSPLLMEREDLPRMHGTNERVAIDTLANASGFYYRLLQSLNHGTE